MPRRFSAMIAHELPLDVALVEFAALPTHRRVSVFINRSRPPASEPLKSDIAACCSCVVEFGFCKDIQGERGEE
jgi:hypothetical protein